MRNLNHLLHRSDRETRMKHSRAKRLGYALILASALLLAALAWPVLAGEDGSSLRPVSLPPTSLDSGWSDLVPAGWQTVTTYLPLVLKNATGDTYEPNNSRSGSYGPLASGVTYVSYIWSETDTWDCYWFDPADSGTITATLTSIPPGADYDLFLYDFITSTQSIDNSRSPGAADEQIVYNLGHALRHYLCVYAYRGWSYTDSYLFRVTYP
jgi:hypothetical protein